MIKEKRRHEVPQLNTTSTADISFMLLTFFLMTTSMDSDKGLPRQLPPIDDDNESQTETIDIKERNVMTIHLHQDNHLTINDRPVDIAHLQAEVEKFIDKQSTSPTDHVIAIQADRQAQYETYFAMQNAIMLAYNDLRNKLAHKRFGKPFDKLTPEQADKIRQAYPQRISEQL